MQIETAHSQQRNTLTSATRKSIFPSTFGKRHVQYSSRNLGLISDFVFIIFGPQLGTS